MDEDGVIKASQNHIEKLADQYRATHTSHDTYFPTGAELSKLVNETVERLRNGGDSAVKASEPEVKSHSTPGHGKGMDYGSIAACGYGLF